MIIDLTKENLQTCQFNEQDIKDLFECDNHTHFLFKDTCYFATNIEKKIYTEIDAFRKFYFDNGTILFPIHCPDLIPDFYESSLNNFLLKQKTLLGKMYNEVNQTQNYIESEIKRKVKFTETTEQNVYDSYIAFLKLKQTEDNSDSLNKKTKDYKQFVWFKTGIPLATGEAFHLYNKYKDNKGVYAKITKELGFKQTDRTYFSTTIGDFKKAKDSNKNTFACNHKLIKLHKHLVENNLPFGTKFLEKYNEIESE
jgi:hypothetical protein